MSQQSKTVTWEVIRLLMDKYHVSMRVVHRVRDLTYIFLYSLFHSATGYVSATIVFGGSDPFLLGSHNGTVSSGIGN